MPRGRRIQINFTRVGWELIEAPKRVENQAFEFIITWQEIEPHLNSLCEDKAQADEMRMLYENTIKEEKRIQDKIDKIGDFDEKYGYMTIHYSKYTLPSLPDFSFIEPWQEWIQSEELCTILTSILLKRKEKEEKDHSIVTPQRGDVVRLEFVRYRNDGTFFFDGENVICSEVRDDERCYIPQDEFLVPSEFPASYWDECTYIGFSCSENLNYDVRMMKLVLEHQWIVKDSEISIVDNDKPFKEDGIQIQLYRDITSNYHVLIINKNVLKKLKTFKNTGKCFSFQCFDNWPGKLKEFIKSYVEPSKTVVVC